MNKGWTRLWVWWVISLVLGVVVWIMSPQQFPVILYKLNLVALSAVIAYWIDRNLFVGENFRITQNMEKGYMGAARLLARAFIYLGTVLGITLGL